MSEDKKNDDKKDDDKKNKNFIQLYRPFIDDLTNLARVQPKAFDLFMFLCKNMDGNNALCASQLVLTECLSCGRATIARSTKYLKDEGWICVMKTGTSNVYIINPDIAWTSYNKQKQYCKFQANVLLSAVENSEFLNNPKATNRIKAIDTDFVKSVQKRREEFIAKTATIKQDLNSIDGQTSIEDYLPTGSDK